MRRAPVLLLGPSARDRAAARAHDVTFVGGDIDAGDSFDPAGLVREAEAVEARGVVGTRDRTALLAAIVAERRNLPGPSPRAVLSTQHKAVARSIQLSVAPAAVPRFGDVEPPCFVKPVVGRLSQGAYRADSRDDLREDVEPNAYAESFEQMAALAGWEGPPFSGFLREQLVAGEEVTLEGFIHESRVTVVGITDSVHYPGTRSFERFEYPTRLPPLRRDELAAVAERVVQALGLDTCFFNIEFAVPESGPPQIIEVNARIASQFAALYEAAHGRSSYDVLFELARGEEPRWPGGDPDGVAVSWVVRVFEDAVVESVPDGEPGVELLVEPGRRLSEQGVNDVASYRLAIVPEHGATREDAVEGARRRADDLLARFVLRPV